MASRVAPAASERRGTHADGPKPVQQPGISLAQQPHAPGLPSACTRFGFDKGADAPVQVIHGCGEARITGYEVEDVHEPPPRVLRLGMTPLTLADAGKRFVDGRETLAEQLGLESGCHRADLK